VAYRKLPSAAKLIQHAAPPERAESATSGAQVIRGSHAKVGADPLTDQAEVALLGATGRVAPRLIRARTLPSPELRLRDDLLVSLLATGG